MGPADADRPARSEPRALTASLTMALIAVGSQLRDRLDEHLAANEITLRHLGALGHLAAAPELSTSDLARRARVTPQSMRATVDHLEALGAIEHRRHGQGRASELVVTDTGKELLRQARQVVADIDDELGTGIDHPDRLRDSLLAIAFGLRDRPGDPNP
ncbi:MAG: MarR family winged helix-turn-helix transcriptional regulator [Actinomycetota bacterium]